MNRLKELREEHGLSIAALARLVGTSHATISRLESGKMQLTELWARKIATVMKIGVAEIFGEVMTPMTPGMAVLGEVQAGVWKEAEVADELRYPPLPILPDHVYSKVRQFALRVRGDSMNRVVQDGMYIVCASWPELGREPEDGDLVVVERRRAGLIETTLKRVRIEKGSLVFVPDSTDPRWQEPVRIDHLGDGEEIAIIALAIGKYERFA